MTVYACNILPCICMTETFSDSETAHDINIQAPQIFVSSIILDNESS